MACRTSRDKRSLVRIVRTPTGLMTIDATGRLSGRGAYLCADGSCRRAALDKNILSRALELPLSDEVREYLAADALMTIMTQGGTSGQE